MSEPSQDSAPRITVVTCLRDEGAYAVDWIAHLRAMGVGQVLAFTNDCSDGTEALLQALAPAGVIHVDQGALRGRGDGPTPQWRALAAAWDHPAVQDADWLAHLDCDEWIALDGPADLPGLIDAAPGADAIALPWRLFGCDGQLARRPGSPPQRFRRAAPEGMAFPALGSFFKTLFRRDGPWQGFGVHRPRQTATPRFVDDRGQPDPDLSGAAERIMLWRGGQPVDGRLVQLNHYSVRSVHEFLVKRLRGLPNRTGKDIDLTYWIERNFNEVPCQMIDAALPAFAAEAARLRDLPGVADAEAAAIRWQDAQLAEVLATPEGAHLCGRLVLAAGSRAPSADLGRALLAQAQKAKKGR